MGMQSSTTLSHRATRSASTVSNESHTKASLGTKSRQRPISETSVWKDNVNHHGFVRLGRQKILIIEGQGCRRDGEQKPRQNSKMSTYPKFHAGRAEARKNRRNEKRSNVLYRSVSALPALHTRSRWSLRADEKKTQNGDAESSRHKVREKLLANMGHATKKCMELL